MAQAMVNQCSGIATFEGTVYFFACLKKISRVSSKYNKSAECVCICECVWPFAAYATSYYDITKRIHLDRAYFGVHHQRCNISAIFPPVGQIPWSFLGPADYSPIILVYTPPRSPHMAVAAPATLWLVAPLINFKISPCEFRNKFFVFTFHFRCPDKHHNQAQLLDIDLIASSSILRPHTRLFSGLRATLKRACTTRYGRGISML